MAGAVRGGMARLALPGVTLRLAGSLSGASVVPGAAAGMVGPAPPPVPVVPGVTAVGGMAVMLPALGAVTLVTGLRRGRALFGCSAAGGSRSRGLLGRAGLVVMR